MSWYEVTSLCLRYQSKILIRGYIVAESTEFVAIVEFKVNPMMSRYYLFGMFELHSAKQS